MRRATSFCVSPSACLCRHNFRTASKARSRTLARPNSPRERPLSGSGFKGEVIAVLRDVGMYMVRPERSPVAEQRGPRGRTSLSGSTPSLGPFGAEVSPRMEVCENEGVGFCEAAEQPGLHNRLCDPDFPDVWRWGRQANQEATALSVPMNKFAQGPPRQSRLDVGSSCQEICRRVRIIQILEGFSCQKKPAFSSPPRSWREVGKKPALLVQPLYRSHS